MKLRKEVIVSYSMMLLFLGGLIGFLFFFDIKLTGFAVSTVEETGTNYAYINLSTDMTGEHYSFVNFEDDLVGWWRMDDIDEDIVIDLSSYGNNGTLLNGASTADGKYGNAGDFDGYDNYISIGDSTGFDSISESGQLTACAWIKPYSKKNSWAGSGTHPAAGSMGVLGQYWAGGQYDYLNKSFAIAEGITAVDGGYAFYVSDDGSSWEDAKSDGALPLNTWSHICGTFDGSTVKLYVNAVQQTDTGSTEGIYNANAPFTIGTYLFSYNTSKDSDLFYNGSIDEVLVFNRALGIDEIKAIYNSSIYAYSHNFTGLSEGVTYDYLGYSVNDSTYEMISDNVTPGVASDSAPSIILNSPNDGGTIGDYSVTFNVTVTDDFEVSNVSLWGNWSNWHVNETNNSGVNGDYFFIKNLTSFGEGTYKWGVVAYDNASQKTVSANRTFRISIPSAEPNITLMSSTVQENTFLVEINTSNAASMCWFNANNASSNITMFEAGSTEFYYEDFDYGAYNITFYCQNQYGAASLEDAFEFRRSVVYEDVYYTNSQGLKIYFDFAFNYTADKGKIVIIPDSWTALKDTTWVSAAEEFFIGLGYVAVPVNTRGKGSSEGTKDAFGWECLDIYELVQHLKDDSDYNVYTNDTLFYIAGASGAGGKAGVCTAKYPDTFVAGFSSVGVLNLTYWWETAGGADVSEIENRVGCDPSECPEAYMARDAAYLGYNTQTPMGVTSNADDDRVSVGCSRQYNESLTSYGKTVNYTEYPTGGHSADFTEAEAWFETYYSPVFIPSSGSLRIGGYVHTKNFSVYLNSSQYMAYLNYDISGSTEQFNISTQSYEGNATFRLYDVASSTEYEVSIDGEESYYNSTAGGLLLFNISMSDHNITVSQRGAYCGDGSCNNGETCSTCEVDCGECSASSSSGSSSGGGSSGGGTSSYSSSASPLSVSEIPLMSLYNGDKKNLEVNVKNSRYLFLDSCHLEATGGYSDWISSSDVRGLAGGEAHNFAFTLAVPEDVEAGNYSLTLNAVCQNDTKVIPLEIEVLERLFVFSLGNVERISDKEIRVSYTLKEASGINQEIKLQFLLFDSSDTKIAESEVTKNISANEEGDFDEIIEIEPSFSGEVLLLVNLNSDVYSGFVEENVIIGSSISGFAVSGSGVKVDNVLSIFLVMLFCVFAFFVVRRIIRSKRKAKK